MRREKIEGRNEIKGIFFEENPDETKRGMKDRLLEVLLRRFIGIIDRISKETIDITSPYVPR